MVWGNWGSIPVRVIPNTQKMVLDSALTLNIIRYRSRVKWSNLGKGVAPFSTPRSSSYWKESPQVTLDYGCQLYLHLYGCTTWIFTKHLVKKLDGNYTRILCAVLNKFRKYQPTMQHLFVFHITLMILVKVWIQLFSLHL